MALVGRGRRLILGALGLASAVALGGGGPAAAGSAVAPTPPATPQAPTVSLDVVPDRDAIERREKVDLVVIVTNKSDTPLTDMVVSVPSAAFQRADTDRPAGVSAFATTYRTITLQAASQAAFGPHKLPVVAEYRWSTSAGAPQKSAQAATITLQVKRRFEEEGKSLPGGTAAFLYLLLPVVPAFLAFDVADRLRKGEALRIPTFGPEHVVPAFLLSLVLGVGVMTAGSFNVELAYSDPRLFLVVLAASAALGACIPALRWLYASIVDWRWAFRNDDSPEAYLRKALCGRGTPSEFVWVEGSVGAEAWAGVRLRQPDGTTVLGARIQVNAGTGADGRPLDADWTTLTTRVFEGSVLKDRRRLVEMASARRVRLSLQERILRGGHPLDGVVAVDGPAQLQETRATTKPLVEPVR